MAHTKQKKTQPAILELMLVDEGAETFYPDAAVKEFLYCISKSFPIKHACALAGIEYDTMLNWLNPNDPMYKAALVKLFHRAQAMCLSKHVSSIHESRDWKAHAFWLERHEASYAPKDPRSPQVINNIGISNQSTERINLTPDMLQTLSKAYDDMHKNDPESPSE